MNKTVDNLTIGKRSRSRLCERMGFSLNEVAGLLKSADGGQCDESAGHKLTDVQSRIELALQELIPRCRTSRNAH
ncbi:hypothetical protein [Candidatus Methylobacter oryzae]|uniref:HTH merR-type domain-containing protein n=1 Tax=Candidatus Methylobacter oryzae TaxID=2497749 RepID=A0ABY3C9M3_9GAMM|nr:hypothetical protein [Candidatus Methylobacter oryzae]TRW93097.1 hypothetical protein EKO24_013370 [Candidatus Methylobacter oryzae]